MTRSKKRRRIGCFLLFVALLCEIITWADILFLKYAQMTYTIPWIRSLSAALAFAFLTAGCLVLYWTPERPWRNMGILFAGLVLTISMLGFFFTDDLKIKVSYELSSASEKSDASTITWRNPETDTITIWHPYKGIFLKQQPLPDDAKMTENSDAEGEQFSGADTISQMQGLLASDPSLTTLESTVPRSLRLSGTYADKNWLIKNALEQFFWRNRADGKDRYLQIEQISFTAGTDADFLAEVSFTERCITPAANENAAEMSKLSHFWKLRVMQGQDCYAVYQFPEEADASYGLTSSDAPEIYPFAGNDMYHIFLPGDYTAAGNNDLTFRPDTAVQVLYAALFGQSYPEAFFLTDNPQIGYWLGGTQYLLFDGMTEDGTHFRFWHYDVQTGYPVTAGYYLMVPETGEITQQTP